VRLLRSNLGKLRRRPASWVTALLLIGLLILIILLVTVASQSSRDPEAALASRLFLTFPGAYALILSMVLGIGSLLAVTYGAAIAGSEWTWGTLKAAIARGESRIRYTLLNYASIAIFTWIGIVLAFAAGVLIAALGATISGLGLSGMGDRDALLRLPELFARAGLAMAMNAALGFAIATVARSQLAGIGVGIGVFFAEGIARIFAPDLIQWFPFAASSAVVAGAGSVGGGPGGGGPGGGGGGFGTQLDGQTAILVVAAWLVASLVVAALWTERAEISG
jgi:ABC-2 type transport system permease protein